MKYLLLQKGECKEFRGYRCFFTGKTYNCPALNLMGFPDEEHLHVAIERIMRRKGLLKPDEISYS